MRLKVDVIVASGPSPTWCCQESNCYDPHSVMTWDYDPVGNGYVASLARPSGNITGLSTAAEISGKQLELLKEIVPEARARSRPRTSTVPATQKL